MSAKAKALDSLVQAFKKWPADTQRVYASFKDTRGEFLKSLTVASESKLPSVENLEAQAAATRLLVADSSNRKFAVSERLKMPQGMPTYYARVAREADKSTQRKESFVTSFREAALGWFK